MANIGPSKLGCWKDSPAKSLTFGVEWKTPLVPKKLKSKIQPNSSQAKQTKTQEIWSWKLKGSTRSFIKTWISTLELAVGRGVGWRGAASPCPWKLCNLTPPCPCPVTTNWMKAELLKAESGFGGNTNDKIPRETEFKRAGLQNSHTT